jgi:AraC-like DNA-binding protein
MKNKRAVPVFEKVLYPHRQSFRAYVQRSSHLQYPWHFHPDLELVLITKGYGNRFVGDNIGFFNKGDLVFIGSNLPHVWINDKEFYNNPKLYSESTVIQISKEYFNPETIAFPELQFFKNLYGLCQYGLRISGKNNLEKIIGLMRTLPDIKGVSGLASFFSILEEISLNNRLEPLASQGYINALTVPPDERLNRVFGFVMENYHQQITMDQVAHIARMNKSAFCRYFKAKTAKTFSFFLNELRSGYASKLLVDGDFSISQVCFECGFQSISNFNKQFKIHTNCSPSQFRQTFIGLAAETGK